MHAQGLVDMLAFAPSAQTESALQRIACEGAGDQGLHGRHIINALTPTLLEALSEWLCASPHGGTHQTAFRAVAPRTASTGASVVDKG